MSRALRIAERARSDVDNIFDWLVQRSVQGAISWYLAFRHALEKIASSPESLGKPFLRPATSPPTYSGGGYHDRDSRDGARVSSAGARSERVALPQPRSVIATEEHVVEEAVLARPMTRQSGLLNAIHGSELGAASSRFS